MNHQTIRMEDMPHLAGNMTYRDLHKVSKLRKDMNTGEVAIVVVFFPRRITVQVDTSLSTNVSQIFNRFGGIEIGWICLLWEKFQ